MRYVFDFALLFGVGWLACWSVKDAVKQFGLDGFLVRLALYFNYLVVCLFVLMPQIRWRTLTSEDDIHISIGSLVFLLILTLGSHFLLLSNRPTRWLLMPAIKWPLCVSAVFIWCFVTASAFCIFIAHAMGRI